VIFRRVELRTYSLLDGIAREVKDSANSIQGRSLRTCWNIKYSLKKRVKLHSVERWLKYFSSSTASLIDCQSSFNNRLTTRDQMHVTKEVWSEEK
jgi:hypothetical protein